ncbi:MAG: 8-oxoguanine deaminase, partial [Nocardiopsaceae bacterium]|nr:8-oxoguanine deaminase [Nocardiopsaceae bacterium]
MTPLGAPQLVLSGCYVVTMDAARAEYASGYVVIDGNQIAAVGAGPVPDAYADAQVIDVSGCL